MSLIRDLIEHYRFPPEIVNNLLDFDSKHDITNGYENRYYYALNGFNQYIMIIDMFTSDAVRYHRKTFTYDINFNILSVVSEYDYGEKTKTHVFTYGSGITSGAVINISVTETTSNITWTDPDTSTGWPNYDFGGRGYIC
jgi:hypothetical protein